jgi:hypothetical protein
MNFPNTNYFLCVKRSGSVVREASAYFIPNPGIVMGFGTLEFDVKSWGGGGLWHRSLDATNISPGTFGLLCDHMKCNILFSFADFISIFFFDMPTV